MKTCTFKFGMLPSGILTAHLTHHEVGWQCDFYHQFAPTNQGFCLVDSFHHDHATFKFVARLRRGEGYYKVARTLQELGFDVTGHGDIEPSSGLQRVWFLLPASAGVAVVGDGDYRLNHLQQIDFHQEIIFPVL